MLSLNEGLREAMFRCIKILPWNPCVRILVPCILTFRARHVWQQYMPGNPRAFSVHALIPHVWFTVDFERKDAGNACMRLFLHSDLLLSDAGNPRLQRKAELQCLMLL
eukprot:TRINITY_DN39741_c0_g1_i1.p1 TRINITY_DN39741_c0_g1~~TRINITY_DN39741_c0_g1_i1.p1  ORF type:complete len:108 (-),score=7.11 TRINITY_DN39741_c0_g1_i1:20-343(-)